MIFLILENLRSLHNVGAIFRTADACGVDKIFLVGSSAVLTKNVINPKIAKTSLGTEKTVAWQYFSTTVKALKSLPEKTSIFCLEQTKNSQNLFLNLKSKFLNLNIALIVGNEKTGVSLKTLQKADRILHIPMYGKHNSLNVACATAIALYQLRLNSKPEFGFRASNFEF